MLKVYAIKDVKGAFSAPFLALNDALAVRNVKTEVNGQKGSTRQIQDISTGAIIPVISSN